MSQAASASIPRYPAVKTTRSDRLGVCVSPISDLSAVQTAWCDLEQRADVHYFLSWGWIGTWLALQPPAAKPRLLSVTSGDRCVALGLISRKRLLRHGVLPVRVLALQTAADPALDCLTIEYNGLLAACGFESQAREAALAFLLRDEPSWDEIVLDGVPAEYKAAAEALGLLVHSVDCKPAFEADLDAIRAAGGGYLNQLSRNTRQQVRRATRLYETAGPLSLTVAQSVDAALRDFTMLKDLHQRAWTARGRPGAFAAPFFEKFHETLIRTRFAHGEIQIARIMAGARAIGCLYSFVWRGRIYFYQSGFEYDPDGRMKPGLVAHYLAIEHNLAAGAAVYDFLAGESQYKRSLGKPGVELTWLRARRPKLIYRLEDGLRSAKRLVVGAVRHSRRDSAAPQNGK